MYTHLENIQELQQQGGERFCHKYRGMLSNAESIMHTCIHALTELSQRAALPLSAGVETKG